jgi:hypothetical protein
MSGKTVLRTIHPSKKPPTFSLSSAAQKWKFSEFLLSDLCTVPGLCVSASYHQVSESSPGGALIEGWVGLGVPPLGSLDKPHYDWGGDS